MISGARWKVMGLWISQSSGRECRKDRPRQDTIEAGVEMPGRSYVGNRISSGCHSMENHSSVQHLSRRKHLVKVFTDVALTPARPPYTLTL